MYALKTGIHYFDLIFIDRERFEKVRLIIQTQPEQNIGKDGHPRTNCAFGRDQKDQKLR
jgi:hypothetical protein